MPLVRSLSKQGAGLFSILIGRIGYDADVDRMRGGRTDQDRAWQAARQSPNEIIWAEHNSGAHENGSADTRPATKWRDLNVKYAPRAGFDTPTVNSRRRVNPHAPRR